MSKVPKSNVIDEYIKQFPQDVQVALKKIKAVVKQVAPFAEETIAYGLPTFKLNGKNLFHFGGWKTHIGLYPTPSPIEEFKNDLVKYKVSKGSIQIPINKPIPITLIKKLVKSQVKKILEKTAKKNKA